MKEERTSTKTTKTTTWQEQPGDLCGISKSTRSLVKVTILWVTYVLMGSFAFIYLEQSTSVTSTEKDHHHWARFKELASAGDAVDELLELRSVLSDLCSHPRINQTYGWVEARIRQHYGRSSDDESNRDMETIEVAEGWWRSIESQCSETLRIIEHVTTTHYWSVVDSIYFTMTVVTTIGYGHISPRTRYGRLFCVLYSLVGVPLTCILMAKSSDLLSNKMLQLYTTAKKRHQRHHKTLLYGVTWVYLSVGFIVFMFIPSVALVKLESWTYEDALYYTFITLSTIGFGDLVAGYNSPEWYSDAYKICIVVWIMVALGYWFLLLNFLQKALKTNVPRRIKKTLHFKTKKMAKQAEFFRHLVGSVRNSQRRTSIVESKREVMALMVEVADALTGDENNRSSRPRSRKPSLKLDCSEALDDSDSEITNIVTLADLLNVNVVIKPDGIPTVRSFIIQSPQPIEEYSRSLSGILKMSKGGAGDTERDHKEEVVLPLRDVLQLVTLIASVEDQVSAEGTDSTVSLQDDISTRTETASTITSSIDVRESLPLLNEVVANKQNYKKIFGSGGNNIRGHYHHRRPHLISHGEENEAEEVDNEVHFDNNYSDDETDSGDDEVASQIDLSTYKNGSDRDHDHEDDVEAGGAYICGRANYVCTNKK